MKGKSRIVFCRMGGDGEKTGQETFLASLGMTVAASIGERRTTTYQLRYLRLRRTELPKEVPRSSVLHSSPD